MALLEKIFGRGEPAPAFDLHGEDQDLVGDADTAWWNALTLKKLVKLEKHDNLALDAIVMDQMNNKGARREAAERHAARSLPRYYLKLEKRENNILNLVSDDAGLPWILKGRVVDAVMAGRIRKEDIEQSSSVNALVQRLVRAYRGMERIDASEQEERV